MMPRKSNDHIIVLPGGGYETHADHEAEPIAEWIQTLGINSSVFRYPVKTQHPKPFEAIRAEVAKVRGLGRDRVGLIGFSAGGHAAAYAAYAPDVPKEERADLVILGYPVVSMLTKPHQGSADNLLGVNAGVDLREKMSVEKIVRADAPPTFMFHTSVDEAVPVEHSLVLGQALAKAEVPFEMHIFEQGHHGVGYGAGLGTVENWRVACADWLKQQGWGAVS
jgi:Esterase/lipase